MGCLCSCLFGPSGTEPTSKTPLLGGAQSRPAETTSNGQSARQHRPEEKEKEFLSSLEEMSQINLAALPLVPSLDKTFQDHGKLYNDLYSSFMDLRKTLHNFKAAFEKETNGIPTISDCLRLLAKQCGDARLTGSRTKNCIQISYDKREVSESCQGPAEDIIECLEFYNKANKLIKQILDKAPQVRSSLRLVLDDENKLQREVTKSDSDGKQGPQMLKVCTENIRKLKKAQEYIETIHKYTDRSFKEIMAGSKVLFENEQ